MVFCRMSTNDSTINLDDSSLLSSTKNSVGLDSTVDLVTTDEEENTENSSVFSASQLISSLENTKENTLASLSAELSEHKMKLSEVVVEGLGVKEDGDKVENIGEIIEETFRGKMVATSFGEHLEDNEDDDDVEEVTSGVLSISLQTDNNFKVETVSSSPHKRKVEELSETSQVPLMDPGEVADVEDNTGDLAGSDNKGLPSKKLRVAEPDLPSTVQVLVSANTGAKVYLVGTAHFSKESCEDVALVIKATQPDIVVVELCKARTNILHLDEATILEEAQNLDLEKSLEIIRTQGTVQGVMYLLLLSMSAHLTKELGMAPGGEFRRAFVEAKSVPGCMVHLGDRPISITLKRALSALSPWQKVRLGWNILTSRDSITKEEVERCKDRDLLENMLAEMAGEFPALSRVFVQERDLFLAHSLQVAADSAVQGGSVTTVVGVVGIGHMPGIMEHWGKVTRDQVRDVVRVEPPSRISRVVSFTVKTAFWGSCLYGAYRLARVPVSRLLLAR